MISPDMTSWVVLIVDDEPDNLGVAQKVLYHNGVDVHIARDGAEGLRVLEDIEPTFVLLDLSMPEMDGWEMLRQLRESGRYERLPVIALTAHAMAGDKERVMQAGFDGYIAKPFRINSLLDDINSALEQFMTDS